MAVDRKQERGEVVLRRARRVGVHEAVVHVLAQAIVRGEIAPGQAFPPIPELSLRLEASPTMVREAMRTLESARLLAIRAGIGIYVTQRDEWNLLDPTVLDAFEATSRLCDIVDDIFEARRFLEVPAARLAAERITPTRLQQLVECFEKMKARADDNAGYLELSREFHATLLRAAGNAVLRSMADPLARIMTVMAAAMYQKYPPTSGERQRGLANQAAIIQAIQSNDPAGAERAMIAHLASVEETVRRNLKQ